MQHSVASLQDKANKIKKAAFDFELSQATELSLDVNVLLAHGFYVNVSLACFISSLFNWHLRRVE